jgi:NAD(P)-dependent dehydrogenase (short-subunit alcohol dehydrogenase family)
MMDISTAQMTREGKTMAEGPLQGKVAIVTGAGSPIGIGHAIALGFVRAGARVAILDINQEWLEQSVREMRAVGGADCALALVTDVTDPDAVAQAVRRTIAELGGLHIVVNNAGTNPRAAGLAPAGQSPVTNFWQISPEAWIRIVAVNLSGPFFIAMAVVGHLLTQGWGRIIGVTTSLDTMYRKGGAPYGPSKAGHEALVAIMAQELEGTGVTANVLVPGGATNTNLIAPDAGYDRAALIQPEVMQAPAVWLASDAAHECNGRRVIAYYWDERLPLDERLAKASAPAAWPQLGRQAIFPPR